MKRFEKLSILAEQETKSKIYQMAMLKHCIHNEGLSIPKMLNFSEDKNASDLPTLMVNLDINDLFGFFTLRQRDLKPNNREGSILRGHITFGIYNDEWTKKLLRTMKLENALTFVDARTY